MFIEKMLSKGCLSRLARAQESDHGKFRKSGKDIFHVSFKKHTNPIFTSNLLFCADLTFNIKVAQNNREKIDQTIYPITNNLFCLTFLFKAVL
jgi:hypothetical protein